jgi:esterase/lipase superfamily enzyme
MAALSVAFSLVDTQSGRVVARANHTQVGEVAFWFKDRPALGSASKWSPDPAVKLMKAAVYKFIGNKRGSSGSLADRLAALGFKWRNYGDANSWQPVEYPHPANFGVQRVYFATDRTLSCDCSPVVDFGGDQAASGSVRYGKADVSIPLTHTIGELETPSLWRLEFRADPVKHIVVATSSLEPVSVFQADVAAAAKRSPRHDAFVFIHGFNTTFQDSLRRTAELAHDLRVAGPAIDYSWPAKGDVQDYLHDENDVAWTTPHLEQFLSDISAMRGVSTIHIIAHSMGNRALAEALADFGNRKGQMVRVSDIVLAAPDIDAGRFKEIADAFHRAAPHVTIYASGADRALQISHGFHGYPRLGDVDPIPLVLPGFDFIDATAINPDWIGHGYFSTSTLMSDIYHFFLGDRLPRFGIERAITPDGRPYWRFVKI